MGNKETKPGRFEAGLSQQPGAERLHDFEAGIEKREGQFGWGVCCIHALQESTCATGKIMMWACKQEQIFPKATGWESSSREKRPSTTG